MKIIKINQGWLIGLMLICLMFVQIDSINAQKKVKKAKDDVELVCVGDGKTLDEAVKMALRSGLEQTYGTFVSANTTILNDELIKDEMVSLSTGNVRGFEIVSKNQSSDGTWNAIVKAVFSTEKLVSYVKSKGGSTELAGELFAMYAKMEKMNEEAEIEVINNLRTQLNMIVPLVCDFSVRADEPKLDMGYYIVNGTIECRLNENAKRLNEVFTSTLQSLSLSPQEVFERSSAGLGVFPIMVYRTTNGLQLKGKERMTNSVLFSKSYQCYGWQCSISSNAAGFDELPTVRTRTLPSRMKYNNVSDYKSAIKEFLAHHQNVSEIYFLRTNILSEMIDNHNLIGEPSLYFVLSDGKNVKTAKDISVSSPYVMGISLLTLNYRKGTLVSSNTTKLFSYKNLEELSKVKQITITPLRDATK